MKLVDQNRPFILPPNVLQSANQSPVIVFRFYVEDVLRFFGSERVLCLIPQLFSSNFE